MHEPAPCNSLQTAFGPHGEGTHGSGGWVGTTTEIIDKIDGFTYNGLIYTTKFHQTNREMKLFYCLKNNQHQRENYRKYFLPGIGLQPENGSPWYPEIQEHTGW